MEDKNMTFYFAGSSPIWKKKNIQSKDEKKNSNKIFAELASLFCNPK